MRAQELVRAYCRRSGYSDAAARDFFSTLREEALATGPAGGAAGGALEQRVAEMLRDVPRFTRARICAGARVCSCTASAHEGVKTRGWVGVGFGR